MIDDLMTHLWQSTIFGIAAALLTLAFRNNRAKVRFGLWLSASLKFFVPFSLLMNLGTAIHWTPAAHDIAAQYATPAVSFAVEYVAAPFTPLRIPAPQQHTDWTLVSLVALWVCGFLAIAVTRLRLWLRVRAAVCASTAVDIPAPVNIRSAPGLLEPGVVGLLKPVLLLPEGIPERLTPSELEAVIAHELCHIRRRDNLFAAIHMIVEAVFWFHPLVWWIGARMVEERERACDEEVLTLGNQPRVYAEAIVSVCKLYVESPLTCVSGITGSSIRRRIEAIMTNRRGQTLNRGKRALLTVAGSLAVAGPVGIGVLIGFGQLPQIHAQSPAAILQVVPLTLPAVAQAPAAAPPIAQVPSTPLATAVPAPSDVSRPLIALLFDLAGTTADEQARARTVAIKLIEEMDPADVVSVILSNAGELRVAQDFTQDRRAVQAAIQSASFSSTDPSARASEVTLVKTFSLLEKVPGRKNLVYYWPGISRGTPLDTAILREALLAAMRANVAVMPVVVRTEGTGLASGTPPEDREMLQKQINTLQMVRMFFGGPSYNLREIPVVYPSALATFTSTSGVSSLPGGASSVRVYPGAPANPGAADSRFASISTPLKGLSGSISVSSEIRQRSGTGREGAVVATLTDQTTGQELYRSNLGISPGTYVALTTVRELATNRFFTDRVDFEVK